MNLYLIALGETSGLTAEIVEAAFPEHHAKLEYTATKEDVQEIKTVIAEKHTDTVTKMGDHHAAMLKVVIGVLSALSVGLLVAVVGWIAST